MKSHNFFLGKITAVVVDTVCADCLMILAVLHRLNRKIKILVRDVDQQAFQARLAALTEGDRIIFIASSANMDDFLLNQKLPGQSESPPILAGVLVREAGTNWARFLRENPTIFGKRVNLILEAPQEHASMRTHVLGSFEHWDPECLRILTDPTIFSMVQAYLKTDYARFEYLISMLSRRAQWDENYLPRSKS